MLRPLNRGSHNILCARERRWLRTKAEEGEFFALEKLMQVPRRHSLPLRDFRNGQIAVAEICCYIGHDRAQPRGRMPRPLAIARPSRVAPTANAMRS